MRAWKGLRKGTVMQRAACLAAVMLMAGGCVRSARLYNLNEPEILEAHFKDSGTGHGTAWIGQKEKTARCRGEYSTVPGGSSAWGTIYTSAGVVSASAVALENEQRGQAILQCADGRVIECEYVTSAVSGGGHGACRDNRDARYRLMF